MPKKTLPIRAVDFDFNYIGKAYREDTPEGLDNLRRSREIQQLLHSLCSPTAGK